MRKLKTKFVTEIIQQIVTLGKFQETDTEAEFSSYRIIETNTITLYEGPVF